MICARGYTYHCDTGTVRCLRLQQRMQHPERYWPSQDTNFRRQSGGMREENEEMG